MWLFALMAHDGLSNVHPADMSKSVEAWSGLEDLAAKSFSLFDFCDDTADGPLRVVVFRVEIKGSFNYSSSTGVKRRLAGELDDES